MLSVKSAIWGSLVLAAAAGSGCSFDTERFSFDGTPTGGGNPGGGGSGATGNAGGGNAGNTGGGDTCDAPMVSCGGTCVDTQTDAENCGECGMTCPGGDNAVGACVSGECTLGCNDGFDDCDQSPGCETPVTDDPLNCGACGVTCGIECAGAVCNDVIDIDAGDTYVCALRTDGTVWCWGSDFFGNLGTGVAGSPNSPIPVEVNLGQPATQISVGVGDGRHHVCAVVADGTVRCWGANSNGQCGIGSTNLSEAPAQTLGLTDVVQVAAGGSHSCAVRSNGEMHCWGGNGFFQTGLGISTGDTTSPALVVGAVDEVALGINHGCLRGGGNVRCWGGNSSGQMGNNGNGDVMTPMDVFLGGAASSVKAGFYTSCAQLANGSLRCWGLNANYQLGNTPPNNLLVPTPVGPGLLDGATSLSRSSRVFSGGGHMGAVVAGDVYLWGVNSFDLSLPNPVTSPTNVSTSLGLPPATKVVTGGGFACVLLEDGSVQCWGNNNYGQVGMGSFAPDPVLAPTPVAWPR